ncbi:hypothetical protein OHC33_006157 [Knufia fluminis]|uniref:Uncharacterized protein n=1 Tax=Knufia fluminis TaxID=191047 RepID=A0AAN8EFP0_9EURO|nr:hypothetical protein OHC33_006157 [Knufia fluminis]
MPFNTGATFVPGGEDAYYMPEVVSPAPQRIGENPTNMQQNVAQFEHQAQTDQRSHSVASQYYGNAPPIQQNSAWHQAPQPQPQYSASDYGSNPPSAISQQASIYNSPGPSPTPNFNGLGEMPNFSPFPALRNPGPNIPPTDEQKELVLEQAREAVLGCNDPEQQLTWAQDALSYCEIAIQNEARVSRTQQPRPRTPRLEHVLREDAMKVTSFLADQSHPKAQFMRGMWYEFGKFGYPVDKPESYQCYKRASDRGYTRAWYRMGMQFESGNDPLTAIKYYKMAAEAGDSAACYRLGMMTLLGQHGQMQDFERGLQLIYSAAHSADDNAPQGAYILGMLQAGELPQVKVPEQYLARNIQGAKINIERAAFLGFAKAQVRMASAYELGELDCPFDPALSLHYNALAARQGEVEAEMAISKWFLCGHEGLFEKSEELAFTYAQRAAIDGLPTAQFAVGYFYEVGIYVSMDLKEAKEWYRKADENGNRDAKKRIEAVSRSKTISRKDHENIALQRIRNQHANSTGQPQMQPLPEVPSPSLDMPDPAKLSLYGQPPPQQRPASTAPYPAGSNLTPQPSVPDLRPTSAFGINPNLRPASAAPGPGQRHDPYNNGQPGRPYSVAHPQDNYGRRPSGPPGGLAPQQRPMGRPTSASPHLAPNPGRQPSPSPHQQRPLPPPQTSSAPNVNLGFSAPVDTQGADRPNWAPRMSGNGEGPRPVGAPPGRGDGYPPRASSGLPSQQGGRPPPSQGYQSNPNRPQQHPPHPRPPQQQLPPQQNVRPANVAPSKPPAAAPPDQPKPQAPQKVSASQAQARPPGKGPKTFDAMGIPAQSDDKDCVVM